MNTQQEKQKFLWLAIYAILLVFFGGRWNIPAAAWLAPIFAIRFYRDSEKGGRAFLWLWLVSAAAGMVAVHQTTGLHFRGVLVEPAFAAVMTLPLLIPYVIDRVFHRRWAREGRGTFWLTLVYPISVTAIDFLSGTGNPMGSYGALAYTQQGFTALMQLTAITGMWGIAFIVSWFASVVNDAWESDFQWTKIRGAVAIYAGVLIVALGFGFGRLALVEPTGQTVQIGGFSLPLDEVGSMQELWQLGAEEEYRAAFKELNRRQLSQVRAMAQEGAQIVVLQEVAVQGLEEEVTAMLTDAANLAQEEGVYLVLPTAMIVPDGKDHNVVRIIDPNGDVVLEHYKYGGAFLEGSVAGSGELQTVETPYGKWSVVICWDADFPATVRQAGVHDVDLLFLPSNDWFGIRDVHAGMATFRAVENGMPIFRQTGRGVSSVIDAYGRVINRVDMHEEGNTEWGGVQMVKVPIGSVDTLYPQIGDALGLAMVVGLVGLLGFAWMKRKKTERTIRQIMEGQLISVDIG